MLLILAWLGCAAETTACERFIAAKKACYEDAGMDDETPATFCEATDPDGDASETAEAMYTCWAEAYEDADCGDADGVGEAGAVAGGC
jgi:hypothetical protein